MEAEVKTKSDNYIQLKNEGILKFGIKDMDGKDTGEYLEFDLEDIELPLRLQQMIEDEKKNRADLRNQLYIIDRKQDHKGKKVLSSNQEAKFKVLNEFFIKEKDIFNMFLGENGVEKLLCGRKLRWTTLNEISQIIEEVIAPKLDFSLEGMQERIKNKYNIKKEDNTLE